MFCMFCIVGGVWLYLVFVEQGKEGNVVRCGLAGVETLRRDIGWVV